MATITGFLRIVMVVDDNLHIYI